MTREEVKMLRQQRRVLRRIGKLCGLEFDLRRLPPLPDEFLEWLKLRANEVKQLQAALRNPN